MGPAAPRELEGAFTAPAGWRVTNSSTRRTSTYVYPSSSSLFASAGDTRRIDSASFIEFVISVSRPLDPRQGTSYEPRSP